MIKLCLAAWDAHKYSLEQWYRTLSEDEINHLYYEDIVKRTFEIINEMDEYPRLDVNNITEINNGDYQGTLIYLVPFETYQPSHYEYLMTYIEYGSCSCCDTLQGLQYWDGENKDKQIKGFMELSKDILCNTIRPYNGGWRNDEIFNTVRMEENEDE